jgi:hypothetical protein
VDGAAREARRVAEQAEAHLDIFGLKPTGCGT